MCEHERVRIDELEKIVLDQRDELARERRSIPKKVDERLYLASAVSLTLQPQSRQLEEITSIIIYCSSAGTLTLADRTFPASIGTTVYNFGMNGLLLYEKDTRTLTQVSQGAMSLELLGVEKADKMAW